MSAAQQVEDRGISTGEVFLRLNRGRGDREGKEELRFALKEFNRVHYVDVRMWFLGRDEQWRPTAKGITIKLSEYHDVLTALEKYEEKIRGLRR